MGEQGTGESISGALVLDAGALIALERGDRRARALVKRSESLGRIVVPASVLAQVWRGGSRSAVLAILIRASAIDRLDEDRAKEVGLRLGLRRGKDITDAHVVCCALEFGAAIATSDPADVKALSGVDEPLSVIRV